MYEVKIMVRVSLSMIKHGIERFLDVGDIEFWCGEQRVSYAINGSVPGVGVFCGRVAFLQLDRVPIKVALEPRGFREIHQTVAVPRIYKVMPGPRHFSPCY